MDQSYLLGDEGGVFDQLCYNLASICYALSLDKPEPEKMKVARALDLESKIRMSGVPFDAELQQSWAEIGGLIMDRNSQLHQELIADIEIADIPLDPRFMERFI